MTRNPSGPLHRSLCNWIDAGLIQYADGDADLQLTMPKLFRGLVEACSRDSFFSESESQLAFKRQALLSRFESEKITEAKISSRIREARHDGTSVERWALYGRLIHISEARVTWRRNAGKSRDTWWIATGQIAGQLFEFGNPNWPLEQAPATPRALVGLHQNDVKDLAEFIKSSIHLRKADEGALGAYIRTSIEAALQRVAQDESNRRSDYRTVVDQRAYDMLYLLHAMTRTTGDPVLDEGPEGGHV